MSQAVSRPEPERLLAADELAPILGMSLDWVYERAKAGDLPSLVLPGGRRKFLYSEVRNAMDRWRG
jgi:predicted DNA-binding transcriptional regulator AlpA